MHSALVVDDTGSHGFVGSTVGYGRAQPEGPPQWIESEGQVSAFWPHVLCLLTFWAVVPALYALWRYASIRAHTYTVTDQCIRESSGVLARNTEMLELYRVKDLTVEQPILYRMFGRGRVILRTTDATTPVLVLNAVRMPHRVAALLRRRVEECRVNKGIREVV